MRILNAALLLAVLPLSPTSAQRPPDARYTRAFRTLLTTAQLGGLVKEWCDARAPEARAVTDTALAAWKSMHGLDEIEARADAVLGAQASAIQSSVAARRASVFRALDGDSKAPERDCRQMLAYLNTSANPQRMHPAEFRLIASQRAATAASAPAAASVPASSGTSVGAAPARGALYSVAQLSALVRQDERGAHARLKQLGTIAVRGTLEPYGDRPDETVWLNTVADGWRSTTSVLCYDLSFRQLYEAGRRAVTIRGTVRKYESWIVLEDCQPVADATGLAPSMLSEAGGLRRMPVTAAQIRTAPNEGVPLSEIEGIYQPADLRYNAQTMLFVPDETTYLVLHDGWLYDNLDAAGVSPHDLNVAESRKREPQHWHRWRRAGTVLQLQKQDEHGRTDGQWTPLKVIARASIGTRPLDGVFQAVNSASVGNAFSMGTTTYRFRPNGTFEWTNLTQSYASSDAGTGAGGGTIVVGGATVGPNGSTASSVGGGDDAGTYRIDGYTLELRTRRGQVHRFSIFAWDAGAYRNHLVIDGISYSPIK